MMALLFSSHHSLSHFVFVDWKIISQLCAFWYEKKKRKSKLQFDYHHRCRSLNHYLVEFFHFINIIYLSKFLECKKNVYLVTYVSYIFHIFFSVVFWFRKYFRKHVIKLFRLTKHQSSKFFLISFSPLLKRKSFVSFSSFDYSFQSTFLLFER